MLDEKLEQYLSERLDLYQQTCYKDKINEIQRRETLKITDLIRSVEAAYLIDNSVTPNVGEDVEMQLSSRFDLSSFIDEDARKDVADVEIPPELLSSSGDSGEDSLDELVRKYDPENAKNLRKKQTKADSKKSPPQKIDEIIDVSHSPPPVFTPQFLTSPISSTLFGRRSFRKFKTFDSSKNNLAGPSFASSPISGFLNVETNNLSPSRSLSTNNTVGGDDEFNRLVAKYDFPSPITVTSNKKSPVKLTKKISNSKLKATQKNPEIDRVSVADEEEDEIKYISVDDINPLDFNVMLLVDTQETSG